MITIARQGHGRTGLEEQSSAHADASRAGAAQSGSGAQPIARESAGAARSRLRRYGLLLAMILAAFATQGVVEPSRWVFTLLTALFGATLMLALAVADARPRVRAAAGAVVGALFVATLVQALLGHVDDRAARIVNGMLVAFAPPAIIVGVLRRLRATQAVTIEAVIGVICVYLLIGMFYAFLYGAIDRAGAVPFFAQGIQATMSHCLYYSLTTLSTVGYGDITSATNLGHTLSVSEALLGQVYLVTVVSLIVGNLGRRRVNAPALGSDPVERDPR